MAVLQKAPIVVRPQGTDQRTEESQLSLGRMRKLREIQQRTPGLYSKRYGMAQLARDIVGGGAMDNGRALASTGTALVGRTSDGIYLRSDALAANVRKLSQPPVSVDPAPVALTHGYRPAMVETAGLRYYFACEVGQNLQPQVTSPDYGGGAILTNTNAASYWYYRVVDAETGTEVVPATKLSTVAGWQARAVVSDDLVWLFIGADDLRYIYAVKFNPAAPTGSPVRTTYYDGGTAPGMEIHGWDVRLAPNGNAAVVVSGNALAVTGGGTNKSALSYLDSSTGLPAASPGVVGIATPALLQQTCVNWLEDDTASPTDMPFVLTSTGMTDPLIYKANTSGLTISGSGITVAGFGATAPELMAGYRASDGTYRLLHSSPEDDPDGDSLYMIGRTAAGATGLGIGWTKFGRGLASKPFKIGDTWYLLAQYDDNLDHSQAVYVLMDLATGQILARALRGQGGDATQRASYVLDYSNGSYVCVAGVVGDDSVTFALCSWNGQQYDAREVTFTVDGAMGPMVTAAEGQEVTIPNGWPIHVAGGSVVEFLPMYPRPSPTLAEYDTTSGGGGGGIATGWYGGVYTYAYRDSAGNVYESEASPIDTVHVTVADRVIQWTVDSLRLTNTILGECVIRLYLTEVQTTDAEALVAPLFLQGEIPNQPEVTSFTYRSYQTAILNGEQLYHQDGAEVPNDPPPPFRWAAAWNDRLILGDTDVLGAFWVSKRKVVGRGYSFSEGMVGLCPDGGGRLYAGGPVGTQYFALFKRDAIFIIRGSGPDNNLRGQYEPERLPGKIGCINPRSLCETPNGLVFQAAEDGGIYLLTLSLELVYLGKGVENHRGRTVASACYVPEAGHVRITIERETGAVEEDDLGGSEEIDDDVWDVTTPLGSSTLTPVAGGLQAFSDGTLGEVCFADQTTGIFYAGVGIGRRQQVSGDFDVQYSWSGFTAPALPKMTQVYLHVYQDDLNQAHIKGIRDPFVNFDAFQSVAKIAGAINNGPNVNAGTLTAATFRIVREGSTITMYVDGVVNHTFTGAFTGPVTIVMALLADTGETASVVFGDYVLNSGLILPEVQSCGDPLPPRPPTTPVLVFDTRNPCGSEGADALGQWYEWNIPAKIDGGRGPVGVVHRGVWHFIDQDAYVRAETPDQWFDDTDYQIRPQWHFAMWNLAGMLNAERLYRLQLDGERRGACEVNLTANIHLQRFGEATVWEEDIDLTTDAAAEEVEVNPVPSEMTALELIVTENDGDDLTEGYAVKAVGAELGSSGKLRRVNADQRR